jgi:hypothetical protein
VGGFGGHDFEEGYVVAANAALFPELARLVEAAYTAAVDLG